MYKVALYYAGCSVFLTRNRRSDGEQLLFSSKTEAERAGAKTGMIIGSAI